MTKRDPSRPSRRSPTVVLASVGVASLSLCALGVLAFQGCSGHVNLGPGCECPEDGLFIELTLDQAAQVAVITYEGPACPAVVDAGGVVKCVYQQGELCTRYSIKAKAEGSCRVTVAFKSAGVRYGGEVVFAKGGGGAPECCQGIYPKGSAVVNLVPITGDAGPG